MASKVFIIIFYMNSNLFFVFLIFICHIQNNNKENFFRIWKFQNSLNLWETFFLFWQIINVPWGYPRYWFDQFSFIYWHFFNPTNSIIRHAKYKLGYVFNITNPTNRHAKYKLGYVFNITNPTIRHATYKLGYVFNYQPHKQTHQI